MHDFRTCGSLRAALAYSPQELRFGTSGRRGQVVHLTQLEVYINARAELDYLLSLPLVEGGIRPGDDFFFGYDLRPSSTRFDAALDGRGEIAQAIEQAIRDAGLRPVNVGAVPTPALTALALSRQQGSIMVTGSHIPFDRNGYKTNRATGELLKRDEAPIQERVALVRARIYEQPFAQSLFDPRGQLKGGHRDLSPETDAAILAYVERYRNFFPPGALRGLRLMAFQHSAVGRDLLVQILSGLGAEVIPVGRSETFVPIDTENIEDALLASIQQLLDQAVPNHGPIDAVVSTDGDSDRPLILGVEPATGGSGWRARFFGGDLVGMITAAYLGADAVVVPITCNDGVDYGLLASLLEPKTRIGSPFVIAGMEKARAKGRQRICGWEPNGGFLTGSDLERDGRRLAALPTRDAMLPILCVLSAAVEKSVRVSRLFAELPARFSKAALLKQFPRAVSLKIMERFSPSDPAVKQVRFEGGSSPNRTFALSTHEPYQAALKSEPPDVGCYGVHGEVTLMEEDGSQAKGAGLVREMELVRGALSGFFPSALGFAPITGFNYTDGVRVAFANGEVAHVRPSGNADELRIYAVAATPERAESIVRAAVAEPAGILRQMEQAVLRKP